MTLGVVAEQVGGWTAVIVGVVTVVSWSNYAGRARSASTWLASGILTATVGVLVLSGLYLGWHDTDVTRIVWIAKLVTYGAGAVIDRHVHDRHLAEHEQAAIRLDRLQRQVGE